MRKLIPILICCLLFGMAVTPAYGEEQQPTIGVAVSGQTVSVAGSVLTAGKQVTLLVKDPSGKVEHIDQKASDAAATYGFQFKIAKPQFGNYSVYVGGDEFVVPMTATFATSGNPGPGPGPGPGSGQTPTPTPTPISNPDFMIVNDSSLASGSDNKVVVEVESGKKGILLTTKAAFAIGDSRLEVVFHQATVSIPPEVLQAALLKISEGKLANAGIFLTVESLTEQESAAYTAKASKSARADITLQGTAVRFKLNLADATNGKELSSLAINNPLKITLKVSSNKELSLIGIYSISDNGDLKYEQADFGGDGKSISAEILRSGLYAVLEYDKSFVDIPNSHWAHQAVKELTAKHVVNGVGDSKFAPDQKVTRAEFAALIVRLLGLTAQSQARFTDVAPFVWYADDIAAAAENGIIQGVSDSAFAPNRPVSREEMAAMLVRAYQVKNGSIETQLAKAVFGDQRSISEWAVDSVLTAHQIGLIQGNEAKLFQPKNIATRAEAAQAIYRLLKK